jgi:hypothetical protein
MPGEEVRFQVPLVPEGQPVRRRAAPPPVVRVYPLRNRQVESAYSADTVGDLQDAQAAWLFDQAEHVSVNKLSVKNVLSGDDAAGWAEAIKSEVFSLLTGGTLVPVPAGPLLGPHKVIHSTTQLKLKTYLQMHK